MPNEILYAERHRPQFHFTARENWLNDPNGCVYDGHEYHLFFQHNPAGLTWGNMTWGHAVSPDLVHWRQLPHAIEPYEGGTIYSGSAVVDAGNTSGFGPPGSSPLVAVFTHARKPYGQAVAFSLDHGGRWTLFEGGRHVVPNQGLDEGERDPKVFWHSPTRRWVMVLWVRKGQARFFTSADLKAWAPAGDFSGDGFYECPDLFALPVEGSPNDKKWVLLDGAFRYWLGSFDGARFLPEAGPLKGDFGSHFYAAQTWANTGARVVQIGWMNGGLYPGMPFNQQMSFPCDLSLRPTPDGLRLCRLPVPEIESLRVDSASVTNRVLRNGDELQVGPRGDLFDLSAEVDLPPDGVFGIRLHELDIVCAGGFIRCLGKEAPLMAAGPAVSLRILVDRTSVEIFANQGRACMSFCFLPAEKDTGIRCYAGQRDVTVRSLVAHRLRSSWVERTEGGRRKDETP